MAYSLTSIQTILTDSALVFISFSLLTENVNPLMERTLHESVLVLNMANKYKFTAENRGIFLLSIPAVPQKLDCTIRRILACHSGPEIHRVRVLSPRFYF